MFDLGTEPPKRRRRTDGTEPKLPKTGERNVLITSALPYVNNVPHLGNLIGCVLSADVYSRFCRQRGVNSLFICGTDEYGTTTEAKAQEEGVSARDVCTKYHLLHKAIYDWFDISFDFFGRTSCDEPASQLDWPQTAIAQGIFLDLQREGLTLEQRVDQVYCIGCDKFLADRFIEGTCPRAECGAEGARGDQCDACGNLLSAVDLISPRCAAHPRHTVEVRSSEHLFLDLPKVTPRLEAWFRASSVEGRWSDNSIKLTDSWLRNGLIPRCITRDLKWGTPVPVAKYSDKVFYVWFDAPIGYISITANYTAEWRQWWQNPDHVNLVQFMGKDNVPFHTVIFPASLIGSGRPWTLLNTLSTTEFLTFEGGKFSKSRNHGVFGDHAMASGIPSEVWRYYLLAVRPETSDADFNFREFADRNNNELLKNLGNFVNRTLRFVVDRFDKKVPAVSSPTTGVDSKLVSEVNVELQTYLAAMESQQLRRGLLSAFALSALGNQYLQHTAPWALLKTDVARCRTVMAHAVNLVRLVTAVVEPFMPGFADKVAHQLNLEHGDIPDAFTLDIPGGHELNDVVPLFRPISDAEVDSFRAQFCGGRA